MRVGEQVTGTAQNVSITTMHSVLIVRSVAPVKTEATHCRTRANIQETGTALAVIITIMHLASCANVAKRLNRTITPTSVQTKLMPVVASILVTGSAPHAMI